MKRFWHWLFCKNYGLHKGSYNYHISAEKRWTKCIVCGYEETTGKGWEF